MVLRCSSRCKVGEDVEPGLSSSGCCSAMMPQGSAWVALAPRGVPCCWLWQGLQVYAGSWPVIWVQVLGVQYGQRSATAHTHLAYL